ncbi:MAG: anthranilate phosphoribosyltransferase, partial [Planctomycetota bacterium]|nr:anthranilate phosphoribosyltransferase [Planctomycetota bacterium]
MNAEFHAALERLLDQQELSEDAVRLLIGAVMDGESTPVQTAALLTALRIKGETEAEIAGAARAMHERAARIQPSRTGLLDTCGTGGDNHHTFNISTATALVIAGVGVPVAKHGNRSVSSSSGSADVLEALGVNVELTPDLVAECIDEVGIGFCFARVHHAAMKHAAPIRKELVFRTIFNLLGPLTNPAGAEFQLIGANSPDNARKLAGALARLNRPRAIVVCGDASLDEVSLWGETTVFHVTTGKVTEDAWTAESFGLPTCSVDELKVDSA